MKRAQGDENGTTSKRPATLERASASSCELRRVQSQEECILWLQTRLCAGKVLDNDQLATVEALWRHGGSVELRCRQPGRVAIVSSIDNRPLEFVLIEREMSRAQQELAALTDFFDNGSLCLHCVAADGTIIRANRQELEFLGYSAEAYLGRNISDFHVDKHTIEDILSRLSRGERVSNCEARLRHHDGTTRFVLINSTARFAPNGEFMHTRCFTQDITEKKLLEQKLERAKEAAEAACNAKDRFLAALSHELRTPLTPATLLLPMLLEDARLPLDVKEHLAVIQQGLRRETLLVNDLLDLSAISEGKIRLSPAHIDLHQLVMESHLLVKSELEKRQLSSSLHLSASSHWVHGDALRLQQVFGNLLQNAMKFTPAGGVITIETADMIGGICVRVTDSGIGVSDATSLEDIFSPFKQLPTSAQYEQGLGLGLAISRAIVELHGGRIYATSAGARKGLTVTIELPQVATSTLRSGALPHQPSTIADERPLRSLRVLLVEDNAVCRIALSRVLHDRLGHTVDEADCVAKALQFAHTCLYDLIISDIGLPDGTGYDLLSQIKAVQRTQRVPTIALTGFGMESDVTKSLEAGFQRHLTKPVTQETLELAIREVCKL